MCEIIEEIEIDAIEDLEDISKKYSEDLIVSFKNVKSKNWLQGPPKESKIIIYDDYFE